MTTLYMLDDLAQRELCTSERALVRPKGCLEWARAFAGPAAKPQAAMNMCSRETLPA